LRFLQLIVILAGVRTVTPKSLLLDLLRVSPEPISVRWLVSIGTLFGFEQNALRVALTRLVGQGLVESDERGSYRLAPGSDVVARLVASWRLGDARIRPWRGGWLCVHHPRGVERLRRAKSQRALERLGFREGLDGLWVRPNNLRKKRVVLAAELAELGLAEDTVIYIGRDFPDATLDVWKSSLWPTDSLKAGLRRSLREIERSTRRIGCIAKKDALVESFLVGGEAIRLLAVDPLLPDEIVDGSDRRRLFAAMTSYDRLGKSIWSEFFETPLLDVAPSHLSVAN
jgi:phenylacetic acid degradation operon negative regulatory protein